MASEERRDGRETFGKSGRESPAVKTRSSGNHDARSMKKSDLEEMINNPGISTICWLPVLFLDLGYFGVMNFSTSHHSS
jgi:hypothetical protein